MAATNIAYWNGVAWNAMGSGLNAQGNAVVVAPNGDVYAGGLFTTAGGVASTYVARWDGLTWRRVGQYGGVNDIVWALGISPDGSQLYVGGEFTDEAGNPGSDLSLVAVYDTSTGLFDQMGEGFFGTSVYALAVADDGTVYAGGDFPTALGSLGGDEVNNVAVWKGNIWGGMGDGLNNTVNALDVSSNGMVVAAGEFSFSGSTPCKRQALWNGFAWVPLDLEIAFGGGSPSSSAIKFGDNGDIFVGGASYFTPSSRCSVVNLIENVGSAETHPIIFIRGPGSLRWIENQTTGARVYLNLTILDDEEITIDFGSGTIESNIHGSRISSILPGSDFQNFTLLPGQNKIVVFMLNDVSSDMRILYTPEHWSADAVNRGEEL